jgi:hypothetical protein
MGLRSTQGMTNPSVQQPTLYGTIVLSFVIPSEAEGSAVLRTFRGNVFLETVPACSH